MKILVLGNANGLGGAQTAFRNLVEVLFEHGFKVGVFSIADGDDGFSMNSPFEMYRRLPFSGQAVSKSAMLLAAALKAHQFAPDVFVSVGLAKSANLIARVLHPQSFKVCQDFIFGRSANDPLLLASAKVFDAIVMQSPSMIEPLKREGFNALPVNWLPCFPESPAIGFRHCPCRDEMNVRLAYFGRLAANKGIDLLLKAFSNAKFRDQVELDIWGTGPELEYLEKVSAELDLRSRVNFKGHYPSGPEAAHLMCSYDGLMLTSTGTEGLPLILLEAMAYGIPFLATDVGAIRDCCTNNPDAILVQPVEDSIREGLKEFVCRVTEGQFKCDRLQQYYTTRFSREVMAARWSSFLLSPTAFFS